MISSLSASVVLSSARTKSSALQMCKVNLMEYIYNEPTQENYTGVKTTPFWNYFFCRFFLRLGEGINGKKTFSFGHCLNHLNPSPLTPIRATWSSFFTPKTTFCAYDRKKNLMLIMKVAMIIMMIIMVILMIIMTKMTKKNIQLL